MSNKYLSKKWQLTLGANVLEDQTIQFKVWAPTCDFVNVVVKGNQKKLSLTKNEKGYFLGNSKEIKENDLYKYEIKNNEFYPDPVSRFLPDGADGYTLIVNSKTFEWHDENWKGLEIKGQVIYEMHIGCFTNEGTFDAASLELEELAKLGITLIELMPIIEFPGEWNQGYDVVGFYSPFHGYGDHEALKRFVDKAHLLGMGVILDVVYNHFGPLYNNFSKFSTYYFSKQYTSDWGDVFNLDEEGSNEVREFIVNNALYWIMEFHIDGFRIDSTHNFPDNSIEHILKEIIKEAREAAAPRKLIIIAENNPLDMKLIHTKEENGFGFDGIWVDDFHHAAIVAALGRGDSYYGDYRGNAQEFISLFKRGTLYQGQASWNKISHGTLVHNEPASSFIFYLQNHDQVSNELRGERLCALTDPGRHRALTALLLLAPETPLIFMGQEFASSSNFVFFADYKDKQLSQLVSEGRKAFLGSFPSHRSAYTSGDAQKFIPNCCSKESFEKSKLDFKEREKHAHIYQMFYDLLKIRREDKVISSQNRFKVDGAVIDSSAFLIRFFGKKGDDRLLLVNLSRDLEFKTLSEPLLATNQNEKWQMLWSSENPNYGGSGIIHPHPNNSWRLPGLSAVLLRISSDLDQPLMEKKLKNGGNHQ